MSFVEETLVGHEAYKDRVAELDKEKPKGRIVFLFEGEDAVSKTVLQMLPDAKKAGIEGTLIHVKVNKEEWTKNEVKFNNDPHFKIKSLPYAGVFNHKLTLGRDTIQKKYEGEKITFGKLKELFH